MASGKIYGVAYKPNGTKSSVYDVWLSWNSSVSGLTSTVNATLYVRRNDGYSNSAWNNFHQVWGRIYCNGNEVGRYDNLDIDTRKSKTATLCSATFSVEHTNGVEKKINLSASFGGVVVSGLDRGTVSSTEVSLGTISIYSPCGVPAWVSVSPNPFENRIKLSWGKGSDGTNNKVKNYYIQYAISSDNSSFSGWSGLTTNESTSAYISPQISRGRYIKYRVRSQGTAGSSYYSDFRESNSVRRILYTSCLAPTSFSCRPDPFESNIILSWNGGAGGENNSIIGYTIEYSTSQDNKTWGSYSKLKDIASSDSSGTDSFDGTSVARGNYIKFRILTRGTAGSSYYSNYKETSAIRRNSKPNPPTEIKTSLLSYVLGESLTISWNEAKDIDNNITAYNLESRNSTDGFNWNEWTSLAEKTDKLSYTFTPSASFLQNQSFVQFRVYSEDLLGAISSEAILSEIVQRDDNTGVRFGIDGKYKKAYLYVGNNGKWVEHDVFAGVSGKWQEV